MEVSKKKLTLLSWNHYLKWYQNFVSNKLPSNYTRPFQTHHSHTCCLFSYRSSIHSYWSHGIIMLLAAFVAKMTQLTTLYSLLLYQNLIVHRKRSFGGLIQCAIHRSLQLRRNFYSKLLPTQMREAPLINYNYWGTPHYLYALFYL